MNSLAQGTLIHASFSRSTIFISDSDHLISLEIIWLKNSESLMDFKPSWSPLSPLSVFWAWHQQPGFLVVGCPLKSSCIVMRSASKWFGKRGKDSLLQYQSPMAQKVLLYSSQQRSRSTRYHRSVAGWGHYWRRWGRHLRSGTATRHRVQA